VAFGSSLDQVGPLTRSVEDAALLLEVTGGFDERDSTTAPGEATPLSDIDKGARSLRVGIPRQYRIEGSNDAAVDACVDRAIDTLHELGAETVDIDLSLTDAGISTYYVIAPAEASSNLARFDGIRYGHRSTESDGSIEDLYACSRAEGFGPEVQRRIMLGTYVLSSGYYDAYYKRALQVRRLIKEELDRAFESCDVLLGATSPFTAFPIGSKLDPLSMYLCDVYTVNTNMAGICGISIPGGLDEGTNGTPPLPIGIHLQAQAFAEPMLIRAASALEQALGYEYTRPM
jgi:aspartyl-tRNA(Asn)/glutamyl-tRNA(Gln) amidotransferase subunit A